MELQEALVGRRTVYFFEPIGEADEGVIAKAIHAAMHAPNHKLTYPWRFTVAGPETRAKIFALAREYEEKKLGAALPEAKLDVMRRKFGNAASMVAVSVVKCDDAFRAREDYASAACAIQNLMLSLWEDGLGSQWGTGAPTRDERSYTWLGIDPTVEEIIGFVWVGEPEKVPETPKRPALESVLRKVA